ncbi:MAG: GT2 family glycosyltransferase [Halioglobus sp.]|jgi:GT2 family glycosyltransferase
MGNSESTASVSADSDSQALSLSIIMPVYNGVDFISRSLPPLIAMLERGEILEIIVVDDSSTDNTAAMASDMGARVVPSGGRLGPGGARNHVSSLARGNILWFVDADVVLHDDAAQKLLSGFVDESVVAVFGSYDDKPPAKNFFSQYKNLVHHYYHHLASEEAQTFWSGCGAVRQEAFQAVGGFDVLRYKYPSIEDIEMGHRLIKAGGRILLRKNVLSTHLKVWRLGNLLHTEIFRRAIPWSRLIVNDGALSDDLNVGMTEQVRAVVAGIFVLALLAALVGWISPAVLLATVLVTVFANLEIALFFLHRKGPLFAVAALMYHQIYYLYSGAAFAWVVVERAFSKLFAGKSTASAETK